MLINLMKTEEQIMADIEEFKRTHRCVKVEGNYPDTIRITGKEPCLICGKFHRLNSKSDKRCRLGLVCMVSSVVNEEEELK